MKENEIAEKEVLPFLRDKLGWPEQLISKYGRVPVQSGTSIIWADFVCYIWIDQKPVPWLLIEVKRSRNLEDAFRQAESYSLILKTPFFCITDGRDTQFFMTGDTAGKSIKVVGMPLPASEYLKSEVKYFPDRIDELIELFIWGLKGESKFLEDTRRHNEAPKQLQKRIFQRIDSLSPHSFKKTIEQLIEEEYLIFEKSPNKKLLFKDVDKNFDKVKKILRFIRDFPGDPINNINQLIGKGDLHWNGCGIFLITQLLAGAYPGEYVVLEDNVSEALKYLEVTDILIKSDTANGYVYVNEICKKLFKDKLEERLKAEGYSFGLAAVHNLLWHYNAFYRTEKKWFP